MVTRLNTSATTRAARRSLATESFQSGCSAEKASISSECSGSRFTGISRRPASVAVCRRMPGAEAAPICAVSFAAPVTRERGDADLLGELFYGLFQLHVQPARAEQARGKIDEDFSVGEIPVVNARRRARPRRRNLAAASVRACKCRPSRHPTRGGAKSAAAFLRAARRRGR